MTTVPREAVVTDWVVAQNMETLQNILHTFPTSIQGPCAGRREKGGGYELSRGKHYCKPQPLAHSTLQDLTYMYMYIAIIILLCAHHVK